MNEYVSHVVEMIEELGGVSAYKMFGGYGIYYDGLMFGLIVDDVLYLKADAENADDFIAMGLRPFVYLRKGKPVEMSYYMAPEEVLEDGRSAARWAWRSYEAALRAAKTKRC